jgi:C1A family cysteine protease
MLVTTLLVASGRAEPASVEFALWAAQHKKTYTSPAEHSKRFHIWSKNREMVNSHLSSSSSYSLALNRFSDLSPLEMDSLLFGYRSEDDEYHDNFMVQPSYMRTSITSIDWRAKGAVTPVKDQGQCGSCWAFSTIVAMEGLHAIETKSLVSLSEQELASCAFDGNKGCQGGKMTNAFGWIAANGGIDSEADYPYESKYGEVFNCSASKVKQHVATSDSYVRVYGPGNNYSEASLMAAVAKQPVSVAIAVGGSFVHYSGGVFDDPKCGTALAHGVAVVGFGTDEASGKDYWLVKNSWNDQWGEGGYVRIARGGGNETSRGKPGICGILMDCAYPCKGAGCPPLPPNPPPNPAPTQTVCEHIQCHIAGAKDHCDHNLPDCCSLVSNVTAQVVGECKSLCTALSNSLYHSYDSCGVPWPTSDCGARPPAPPPPPPPGCAAVIPAVNAASAACHTSQPSCCPDTKAAVDMLVGHGCVEYCLFLKNSIFHQNMRGCGVPWPIDLCGPEPPSSTTTSSSEDVKTQLSPTAVEANLAA